MNPRFVMIYGHKVCVSNVKRGCLTLFSRNTALSFARCLHGGSSDFSCRPSLSSFSAYLPPQAPRPRPCVEFAAHTTLRTFHVAPLFRFRFFFDRNILPKKPHSVSTSCWLHSFTASQLRSPCSPFLQVDASFRFGGTAAPNGSARRCRFRVAARVVRFVLTLPLFFPSWSCLLWSEEVLPRAEFCEQPF